MSDDLIPSDLSTALDVVREDRAVLRVAGEVDLLTAPQLADALAEAQEPGRVVVVDTREVTFMDSSGLRTLLQAHQRAATDGGGLVIDAAQGGPVARLLDLAGVRHLFLDDAGGAAGI